MSETVEPAPVEQVHVEAPKRNLWKIIVPIIIIVVAVGAGLTYWWLSNPPIQHASWFVGAYAEYGGETTVLFSSVTMTMRMEVVERDENIAKLLLYLDMETDGESFPQQTTQWIDLNNPDYGPEGFVLVSSYEDHIYFENIGTRYCIVKEYSMSDMISEFYIDKQSAWPMRMVYTFLALETDLIVELNLIESNVPALK